MKEIDIIKAISKTYIIILNFFILFLLVVIALYGTLSSGIYIKSFETKTFKVEKLYIKWDKKLQLYLKSADIKSNKSASKYNPTHINKIVDKIPSIVNIVDSIKIDALFSNSVKFSVDYSNNSGNISIIGKDFNSSIEANISKNNIYILSNSKFKKLKSNTQASLNIETHELFVNNKIQLKDIDIITYAKVTSKSIDSYSFMPHTVKSINPLVNLAKIDKNALPWIVEYVDAKNFKLTSAKISYEINSDKSFLHSIVAKGKFDKLKYHFNKKLAPISTSYTDVVFKDGILNIHPNNGYFYENNTDKSWLQIDFNPDQVHLYAYILTTTNFSKNIVKLLDAYAIPIPFYQIDSTTKTNLTLNINLESADVQSFGTFELKESDIEYKNEIYHINKATIKTKDSIVTLKDINASYSGNFNFSAQIDGKIDFKNSLGYFDATCSDLFVDIGSNKIVLNQDSVKLHYKLHKPLDEIEIEKSKWKYKDIELDVDKFSANMIFDDATIYLNNLKIFNKNFNGYVNGVLDLQDALYKLDVKITKLNTPSLKLLDKSSTLHVDINRAKTEFRSSQKTSIEVGGSELSVTPVTIIKDKNVTTIKSLKFFIDDVFISDINGTISDKIATVQLSNSVINSQKLSDTNATLILKDDEVEILLDNANNLAQMFIDENATTSKVVVKKRFSENHLKLTTKLKLPYSFIVQNGKLIDSYDVKANIYANSYNMIINRDIKVDIEKNIDVMCQNIGVNYSEIQRYLKNKKSTDSDFKAIEISARGSYIYLSKNSHILSDELRVSIPNSDNLYLYLLHNKGFATLNYTNGMIESSGDGFDDKFLNALFKNSTFKDGVMKFWLDGSINSYKGILEIDNSRILNFTMLNNLLAFVNTIPSLATFSQAGYSKNGMEIKKAIMNVTGSEDDVNIRSFEANSGTLTLSGNGDIDLVSNSVDVNMSMKTKAGNTLSKVPLIGYILAGDESEQFTTFKIDGDLRDPTVTSNVLKDIAFIPLDIVRRTVMLPYNILKQLEDINSSKE